MEILKWMGRKCLSKRNLVALILIPMKFSLEQEEEKLKKEHFEGTSIYLSKSVILLNITRNTF